MQSDAAALLAAAKEERAKEEAQEQRRKHVRQLCAAKGLPATALWDASAVSRYVATGEKKSDKALLAAIRTAQARVGSQAPSR